MIEITFINTMSDSLSASPQLCVRIGLLAFIKGTWNNPIEVSNLYICWKMVTEDTIYFVTWENFLLMISGMRQGKNKYTNK